MAMSKAAAGGDHLPHLPPGFRFHPTDEEIITHYLTKKVIDSGFTAAAVGEADLNKCEPWELPSIAKMGEKEWYFFVQKDRKYPTGTRTNRATLSGYWKATGKDKEIYRGEKCLVGMKKTLVFYLGRAPRGEKTNWIMHEFRLEGNVPLYNIHQLAKDEWAVCRVFHKTSSENRNPNPVPDMPRTNHTEQAISTNSLPPLIEPSYSTGPAGSSFTDGESEFKAGIDHMASSTFNNTISPNPNNNVAGINYLTVGGYQMNPSLNPNPNPVQPVFNPNVQANTSVFRANGPVNPSYYYNLPGNINIAQCKVEPYQSMPMLNGPDQYTGLSTNLNPAGTGLSTNLNPAGTELNTNLNPASSFKPEPLFGSSSMPEFEDLISQFINSTDSDTGFGFSLDF